MLQAIVKISVSVLLLWPGFRIIAQDAGNGIDTVYGFDPVLYNGRYYTYQMPRNANGNPYLLQNGFEKGSLTVLGRTYRNLELNYDIYNQVLLLKYTNHEDATTILEVPESWLSIFSIGPSAFELERRTDGKIEIYQFFNKGSVKVRYGWKKVLKLENIVGTPVYTFSKPYRDQTIVVYGKETYFKRNKDFIMAFDPSVRVNITNYLKINKIRVNKTSDIGMNQLVNFCNTLMNP